MDVNISEELLEELLEKMMRNLDNLSDKEINAILENIDTLTNMIKAGDSMEEINEFQTGIASAIDSNEI